MFGVVTKSMERTFLGLRHVALNVQDVEKSVDFYTRVLGMRVEWRPDPENAYLTSGGDNLALHKLKAAVPLGQSQSLDHIGFILRRPEDVDNWATRLKGLGIALVKEPKTHRDGARSLYFKDPDGLLIQLIYHPPISENSFTEE
jgi:catechol 2,3-dioxygenase-like lactoylglutathione lyase family enzyme